MRKKLRVLSLALALICLTACGGGKDVDLDDFWARLEGEYEMPATMPQDELPEVLEVYYPGLESHPDHKAAARQMSGFGGVVSFTLRADLRGTAQFLDRLKIPFITPSLGGAESLVNQPALLSYYSISAEDRAALGIKDNLVRYALGFEDAGDLIADLQTAFDWLEKQG